MSTPIPRQEVSAPPPGAAPAREAGFAQLPTRVAQALWRGSEMGQAAAGVVATGFAALDAELPGGGWPTRSLTELLLAQPAVCEWRLLAPGLAPLAQAGGQILLVAPPRRPHAPGLAQAGLAAERLVWLDALTPAERLWTTEQLIRSNPAGAILAWLPQATPEQLRRLQLQALACEAPVFLLRPATARHEASPAPLRLEVGLRDPWRLEVGILKRRGATNEGPIVLSAAPVRMARVLPPRLVEAAAAAAGAGAAFPEAPVLPPIPRQ